MNLLLYVVRGLPGSGKSTLAKSLVADGMQFEADAFFVQDGKYVFDAAKLKQAHEWCKAEVEKALASQSGAVSVANTFSEKWEYQPYLTMAKKHGFDAQVITCSGSWKNVHNVPESVVLKMSERWQCQIAEERKKTDVYEQIKELAELQFTTAEVSIIIERPESMFETDKAASTAFLAGRLKAQAEVRKAMLQMAKQGSTPAQKQFFDLAESSHQEICE